MVLNNNEKNIVLNIFILASENKSLNRKTLNSISLINEFPLNVKWINSFNDFVEINNIDDEAFYMFMKGGDHIARSFIESFFNKKINSYFAYQPEYSYIFSERGKVFYRKNIDITPETDEVNTLMLYPHHSRHIIFPGRFAYDFIKKLNILEGDLFWKLAQYLIENNVAIVTLLSCITLEYFNINNLKSKEQIYLFSDPCNSSIFNKNSLFVNQSFSNLYE